MKTKTYLLGAMLCLLVASCSNDEPSQGNTSEPYVNIPMSRGDQQVSRISNDYAWKLMKSLDEQNKGNLVFSPLSVFYAMTMTANGAAGDTRKEIMDAFGYNLDETPIDSINSFASKLVHALSTLDKDVSVQNFNSVWLFKSDSAHINQSYYDLMNSVFNAEIFNYNSSDPGISPLNEIDSWISSKTGNISVPMVYDSTNIKSGNTKIYPVNILNFKGIWGSGYGFNPSFNRFDDFTDINNEVKKIEYMYNENHMYSCITMLKELSTETADTLSLNLKYLGTDGKKTGFRSISIPFKHNYAFTIIMPIEGKSIGDAINYIISKGWNNFRFGGGKFNLTVPKFKTENCIDLKDAFISNGIKKIFDICSFNDFSLMFDDIDKDNRHISSIVQGNSVEINEEGAQAVAVTVVTRPGAIIDADDSVPEEFKVDHPFIYLIHEQSTGAILFLGKVEKL